MHNPGLETMQQKKIDQRKSLSINSQTESIISFIEEVPVYLNDAIRKFID